MVTVNVKFKYTLKNSGWMFFSHESVSNIKKADYGIQICSFDSMINIRGIDTLSRQTKCQNIFAAF